MTSDSHLIFESYKQQIVVREGWKYTVAQILDPTGALSYPDLIKATVTAAQSPTTVNLALWALAVYSALPNLGVLAAGWGAIPWLAAKGAAKGVAKNPKLLAKAGNAVTNILRKQPARKAVDNLLSRMTQEGVISAPQSKALAGILDKGGNFRLTKADVGLLKKGEKGAGQFVKTLPELGAGLKGYGKLAGRELLKQATFQKGTRGRTVARALQGLGAGAIGGIPGKLQDTSTTTTPSPFPELTPQQQAQQQAEIDQQTGGALPQSSSSVMTSQGIVPQNIFQARGGEGARVSSSGEQYGVMSPPNYGQGATEENPEGRENMSPNQYMMPNTFNMDPASLFQNFFNAILSSQTGRVAQGGAAPGISAQRPGTGAFSRYNQLTRPVPSQQSAAPTQQQQTTQVPMQQNSAANQAYDAAMPAWAKSLYAQQQAAQQQATVANQQQNNQPYGAPSYQTPYGAFPNDKFASAVNLLGQFLAMR